MMVDMCRWLRSASEPLALGTGRQVALASMARESRVGEMSPASQGASGTGFRFPDPPFHVALVEPDIPPNTGNIARLCAATGTPLHLVEPLGFRLTDAAVRRAGLDYWESVELHRHRDLDDLLEAVRPERFYLFSTKGNTPYVQAAFRPGDLLIFGCETRGLSEELLKQHADRVLTIPMLAGKVRSLNLANAVSIVLYEALRQGNETGMVDG